MCACAAVLLHLAAVAFAVVYLYLTLIGMCFNLS